MILYVLSPALIGGSLYRTTVTVDTAFGLLIGFFLISICLYLIVKLIAKVINLSSVLETSLTATTLFPNNGNMGLSVVTFAFGSQGLERAIIYMIGSSILMYTFAPALLQGKGLFTGLKLTFRLPLIWAILAGLTLRLLQIKLPFNLDPAVAQLGNSAIPLMLLLLGIQLATTKFRLSVQETLAASLRLIVAPIIAYSIAKFLRLEGLDLQVLVLQSSMPTAVSSIVLVNEFGGNTGFVARTIVISTLLAFVTLPIILSLPI
ncbi:MAG: AEC family transporter [Cyanobacteria bacterium J083]|nr:MAG: AEC family transporter [Cyanobacteria bacterium J083]